MIMIMVVRMMVMMVSDEQWMKECRRVGGSQGGSKYISLYRHIYSRDLGNHDDDDEYDDGGDGDGDDL